MPPCHHTTMAQKGQKGQMDRKGRWIKDRADGQKGRRADGPKGPRTKAEGPKGPYHHATISPYHRTTMPQKGQKGQMDRKGSWIKDRADGQKGRWAQRTKDQGRGAKGSKVQGPCSKVPGPWSNGTRTKAEGPKGQRSKVQGPRSKGPRSRFFFLGQGDRALFTAQVVCSFAHE